MATSEACQVLTFPHSVNCSDFSPDFVWGVSTSAFQIEGAAQEGGRGSSLWDAYCLRNPGRIDDGTNGNTACKAYFKTKEDVQMLKKLGVKAYRFSMSWSRILPGGKLCMGINQEGVDYYNNLINELIANGIEPYVTLFHWDTPNDLEEEYMGFLSVNIVCDFLHYVEFCFWEFGDRVKNWMTLNEPYTYANGGYASGHLAPGRGGDHQTQLEKEARGPGFTPGNLSGGRYAAECLTSGRSALPPQLTSGDPGTEPYIVAHNLLLCHAMAVKLYREKFQASQNGKIGVTLVSDLFLPLDPINPDDVAAARRAQDFTLGWFMDPLVRGKYPDIMVKNVGARLPTFTEEQSTLLKGSFDFMGVNYYTSSFATTAHPTSTPSYATDSQVTQSKYDKNGNPIGPQGGTSWLYVYPEGLYGLLKFIKDNYGNFEIYITENGYCEKANSAYTVEEARIDKERISYLDSHLGKLRDAVRDGVNVKGYFAWSLMDNFEWGHGYTVRFGLFYVDFKNGFFTRYPKQSVFWFMEFLRPPRLLGNGNIVKVGTKRALPGSQTSEDLKKTKIRTT